jgi:peptide/nickel transport system permease protein
LVFFLMRLAPGDPAVIRLGMEHTREQVEGERKALGLDRPVHIQYIIWVSNLVRGDLGVAFLNNQPVGPLVVEKFKRTIPLAFAALVVAVVTAIPLGIIAGIKPYSWLDNIVTAVSLFGISAPNFWVGLMLILFFAVRLGWLPTSGYGPPGGGFEFKYLILPAVSLGTSMMGSLTRYMRSGMLDVMSSDYIRTAHAKGLRYRSVVLRHGLKNALLSVVTIITLDIAGLLGGALVTENVFRYPGMGQMLVSAVQARDYHIVQAVVMLAAVVYVLLNLMADIIYAYLDPRIRYD